MKFLLSSTAISTLLFTSASFAAVQDKAEETKAKDVDSYVEESADKPITPADLDQDALDGIEDAETLNKVVLEATTDTGDGKVIVEKGDGERQQVTADASTTPDRPDQEQMGEADDDDLSDTQRRQQNAIANLLNQSSEEMRTAETDVDAHQDDVEPDNIATTAEVKSDETDWDPEKEYQSEETMKTASQEKAKTMQQTAAMNQSMDQSDEVFFYTRSVRMRPETLNAERLLDADIYGMDDDDEIADLDDLIINASGQVTEAVLKAGGVLGLGEKTYVVPFDQLNIQSTEDELRITMNADEDSVEALAPWSRDEFAIGEDGMTLLSELADAELSFTSIDGDLEVEDVIVSARGMVRSVIVDHDGERLALDYDRIEVIEGDSDGESGYRVNLRSDEFEALPVLIVAPETNPVKRMGNAISNAADATADKAKEATRGLRNETRETASEAEEAAENAEEELEETGNEIEAETRETMNEAENAAEAAEEEAEETANEAADAVENAGDEVEEGVEEATDDRPNN